MDNRPGATPNLPLITSYPCLGTIRKGKRPINRFRMESPNTSCSLPMSHGAAKFLYITHVYKPISRSENGGMAQHLGAYYSHLGRAIVNSFRPTSHPKGMCADSMSPSTFNLSSFKASSPITTKPHLSPGRSTLVGATGRFGVNRNPIVDVKMTTEGATTRPKHIRRGGKLR